nr:dna-directed rna polymerase iii subunit rpc4 [Quercus suber]
MANDKGVAEGQSQENDDKADNARGKIQTESEPGCGEVPPETITTTSANASTSTRTSRGGAKPRVTGPKFATRRSQAARAELEKAEAARKAAEAAEAAKRARKEGRSRGRGVDRGRGVGRGRGGGFIGDINRPHGSGEASGPFSLGQVNWDKRDKANKPSAPGSGGGGTFFGGPVSSSGGGPGASGGSSGRNRSLRPQGGSSIVVKQEGGERGAGGGPLVAEDGGYISSDADDDAKDIARRDVDLMGYLEDKSDEEFAGMKPMRLRRHEHKERHLGIHGDSLATDMKTEVSADSAKADEVSGENPDQDFEITKEEQSYHGVYSSSENEEDPQIKPEPSDNNILPRVLPHSALPKDPPSSPESKRKGKELVKNRTDSESKKKKPTFQTADELAEYERVQEDLNVLRNELGTTAGSTDRDGDQTMGGDSATANPRDNKVYLFQFPPVLPDLLPIQVKPDPEGPSGGDAMDIDSHPAEVDDRQPADQRLPNFSSGMVGKLRIHKSGRATLDWGGTPMNLNMGTEVSFLQDIMVVDMPDTKEEGVSAEPEPGVGMSMGQVRGKFVVTPDWDKILE